MRCREVELPEQGVEVYPGFLEDDAVHEVAGPVVQDLLLGEPGEQRYHRQGPPVPEVLGGREACHDDEHDGDGGRNDELRLDDRLGLLPFLDLDADGL